MVNLKKIVYSSVHFPQTRDLFTAYRPPALQYTLTYTLQMIPYVSTDKKTYLSFYTHETKICSNFSKLNFQKTAKIGKI